jgi:hypothetical protein
LLTFFFSFAALITSYDTYEELLGKSQKGQEFYKKLSHNVNQLLSRMRSTCQVQQEERAQQLATQTTKGTDNIVLVGTKCQMFRFKSVLYGEENKVEKQQVLFDRFV